MTVRRDAVLICVIADRHRDGKVHRHSTTAIRSNRTRSTGCFGAAALTASGAIDRSGHATRLTHEVLDVALGDIGLVGEVDVATVLAATVEHSPRVVEAIAARERQLDVACVGGDAAELAFLRIGGDAYGAYRRTSSPSTRRARRRG